MNILMICDEYPPCQHGGIGTVTQNLARELVTQGHEVVVCGFYPYYRPGKYFEDDKGVKVYRKFYGSYIKLKLSRNKFSGRFFNIKKQFDQYTRFIGELITENKIDLIEIPDFNEAFRYSGPLFISYPDFKVAKVVKLHGNYTMDAVLQGNDKSVSIYEKEKYHVHHSEGILAISDYIRTFVQKEFNIAKKISIIHNGIPVDPDLRLSYNGDDQTVVFAGRLSKKKGIINLLKAWKDVRKVYPKAVLLLFGQPEKETEEEIKSLIDESVKVMGFVAKEELPKIYKAAACAVFPSYIEPFGMAPIEAMSVGCPVIFTERAAGPEIINDKKDGYLVDPENTGKISDAIKKLLGDKALAREIGINGFNKIVNNFSIAHIARQHIEYYLNFIKN